LATDCTRCYTVLMSTTKLIDRIRPLVAALKSEGVSHLAIFGSRARGDDRPDSDLDVLIDIQPGARFSLINLSSVALMIEDTTGLPVQVVLRRSVPADFQARIADDLVEVF
jgi:uncharacterized protein